MRTRPWFLLLFTVSLLLPAAAQATKYEVDQKHTSVGFKIRHLFSNVEGRFDKFEGEIEFDVENLESASVKGTIDVASINTNVADRDKHLRGSDFFNVADFPQIKFESTKVSDVDKSKKTGKIHGNLTMHGVTKPVVMEVAFFGQGTDPWGNKKAGFSARLTVNRKDFGLNWNETLETGGLLVGEEVHIRIEVEGNVVE